MQGRLHEILEDYADAGYTGDGALRRRVPRGKLPVSRVTAGGKRRVVHRKKAGAIVGGKRRIIHRRKAGSLVGGKRRIVHRRAGTLAGGKPRKRHAPIMSIAPRKIVRRRVAGAAMVGGKIPISKMDKAQLMRKLRSHGAHVSSDMLKSHLLAMARQMGLMRRAKRSMARGAAIVGGRRVHRRAAKSHAGAIVGGRRVSHRRSHARGGSAWTDFLKKANQSLGHILPVGEIAKLASPYYHAGESVAHFIRSVV